METDGGSSHTRDGISINSFEAAVDAIVTGDSAALSGLLRDQPDLVVARSTREHRSTLLHYVSANGVEDFRQKTPPNIVEIARVLIGAGADVNAESDAYAGRSATLMLTATSVHPLRAGVQLALLQFLLDSGARINARDVTACLRNGRGAAAEFLASFGAPLDFEAAAGVGRIDLVEQLLSKGTCRDELIAGFAWACEFGRTAVVERLLELLDVNTTLPHHGQTGLHWAAYGGHTATVRLLIRRGAKLEAIDDQYGGTPLDWARHSASQEGGPQTDDVIALLLESGALK